VARLTHYNRKRNFDVTPEPPGRVIKALGKARRFVIQRHDATRLHFDLRLELDGVYKSWAVTKVPSLDPATKRLAVEVEDHPIDYGTFEGTIPEGEYGGGTVQLWDKGKWTPQSTTPPEKDLAKGHLKLVFDGERMHGGWALIRLRDKEENRRRTPRHNWLLIKEIDDFARPGEPDTLLSEVTSVKTGRTLEEIASKSRKVWHSNRSDPTTSASAKQAAAKRKASASKRKSAPAKARKASAKAKKKRR
jgi:bifunctional non-homologous end joining protein LigD